MRVIGAVILVIMILFVGIIGISTVAQDVQDTAVTNGTNASADAYNATTDVTEGIMDGVVPLVVYGGIGTILIVAMGYLVIAGSSGR
jgi:hypothetical protein